MSNLKSTLFCGTILLVLGGVFQSWAEAVEVVLPASVDATIQENYPTADNSGGTTLRILTNNGGNAGFGQQGLVKFDIAGSGLDADKVYRARLRLYVDSFDQTGNGSSVFNLEVLRCTADWDEGGNYPTWNTHNTEYDASLSGNIVLDPNDTGSWVETNIDLALVKGWIDGSINNYGLQLYGNNTYWGTNNPLFSSSEGSNAPQLLIHSSDYVLPASADGTIAESYPDNAYTTGTTLEIRRQPSYNRHSLIKFDFSGSGLNAANVTSVKLRIYVNEFIVSGASGAGNFTTQVRANTLDFNESTNFPTWTTHNLAYGSTLYGQLDNIGVDNGGPEPAGWREIDLNPALVRGWIDGSIVNNGFHLLSNNYWRSLQPRFSSKEGAHAPQLLFDISDDYTYLPSADGTIAEDYPDNDYTSGSTLQVMSYPTYNRHSLIKFDLSGSGINAERVASVKLRLYVNEYYVSGGGAGDFTTQVRANTLDFDEELNFPTWTTHNLAYDDTVLYGQLDNIGLSNGGPEPAGWREIELNPALVRGWLDGSIANNGFHLLSNNYWRTLQPRFSSKEGTYAPQLVIRLSGDYIYLPTADTYIAEHYPDNKYTTLADVRIGTNNLGNITWGRQGLMKFNISGGLDATSIASAKLRLYVDSFNATGGGSHAFKLDILNGTADWAEDPNNAPTWNTHNTAHDSLLSSIVLDGTEVDTWVEMDLDLASVRGWADGSINNYGIQLYGHDSYWRTNNPYFSSKEGANSPQLILAAVGPESWSPNPGDGDPNINTSQTLSWSSGKNAVSHDVYFGEDPNAVAAAQRHPADIDGSGPIDLGDVNLLAEQWLLDGTADLNGDNTTDMFDFAAVAESWQQPGDPTFMGNQTANSFVTGTLDTAKTYYWRIDEVNVDDSITIGTVWAVHVAYDLAMPASSANPQAVAEVLAGKRTIANAAWWGFNGTDDTDSIQGAIDSGARKVIVPYMSSDWNVRPIALVSNQDIYFEPSVVVIAKQGEFHGNGDTLFRAPSKWNIKIYGDDSSLVTLQMRKADYLDPNSYTPSEGRMLISLVNCSNVEISGLTLKDSGGDGVYLGDSNNNIVLQNLIIDNSLRNNLSVIGAENLLVENCVFKNSSDGPINDGIDFEPNGPNNRLVNCVIRNCEFSNNDSVAIRCIFQNLDASSDDVSISVEDCNIVGGSGIGILIGSSSVGGTISYSGCTIANLGGEGLAVWAVPNLANISFTDCTWTDVTQVGVVATWATPCGSPDCITVPGAVTFSNCFIYGRDAVNPSLLPVDLESSSGVTVVP